MDTTGIKELWNDSNLFLKAVYVVGTPLLLFAVFSIAYAAFFANGGESAGRDTVEDRYWAESTCEKAVDQQLKAPATAEHEISIARELSDGEWLVSGTVDAENTFGGLMRHTWTCDADLLSNGDWRATATVN